LTLLEISKYFAEWSVAALLTTFSITSILTGVYLVRNGLCEDHITIGRIDNEGACPAVVARPADFLELLTRTRMQL